MAKKFAQHGLYVISQEEDGAIKVWKSHDNQIEALRVIAKSINFAFDPAWTTRQFGHKLIQHLNPSSKSATSGEYVILEKKDGSIVVLKCFDNVIGTLREIAGQIGFAYDKSWNTRQFGSKLINHLNA